MSIKSIRTQRNLSGKRVLVRVDFNVPIEKGKVLDDTRLRASLSTIQFLVMKGAKVMLLTHIGRPEGKKVRSLSVDPLLKPLSKILGKKVKKIEIGDCLPSGDPPQGERLGNKQLWQAQKRIQRLPPGSVALLENVRFSPDEEKDANDFSKKLASLGDLFVLDGFGVAHRASATVVGLAEHLPSYAGLLLEQEVRSLDALLTGTQQPFVAVLGGIKTETKLPVLKHLLPKASNVLVGGGIFNTYLKAKGYRIGGSIVDPDAAKEALAACAKRKVILPVDAIVGTKDGKRHRHVRIKKTPHEICKKDEAIFDIGPETVRLFALHIQKAKTLVWNGAMGYFEQPPYDMGTKSVARLVASRSKGKAYGVIGGGETIQAMEMVGMTGDIDFVSTGGGAMLEYLSGKKLPGIEALLKK